MATAASPSVLREMGAGFRYVWNWKGLFALLVVATLLNLVLAPASALMPIFVIREFGGAALELSFLQAGWGLGTVAGGLLLGVWGGFRRRIYTSVLGLVGIGASFVVAGLAPREAFWLAVAAMFVSGGMGAITNGPIFAILQSIVTPEMQGRVFTVVGSAAMAMMPLGIIFAGPVADTFGVRICYVAGGLGCVLISLACLASPVILHIEEQKAPAEAVVDLSGAG